MSKRMRKLVTRWWVTLLWVAAPCPGTPWVAAAAAAQATAPDYDVCVVGGGFGGFSAALAAAREGAKVVLVEKQSRIGGTGTAGLVCAWGSGPGDSTARELYDRLFSEGKASVTVRIGTIPYFCMKLTDKKTYADTLRRPGADVSYDPDAMAAVMLTLLREHGVQVRLNTTYTEVEAAEGRVNSITVESADGKGRITAKVFIDATGDIYLCRDAGCETAIGKSLNGVTLCYRVTRGKEEDPEILAAKPVKRVSHNQEMPGGDRVVNMLPTVNGDVLLAKGYEATLNDCRKLVRGHWAYLRQGGDWREFRFAYEAPMLGVREGPLLAGEYTLTADDLTKGYYEQGHPDMIALAMHPVDVHGSGHTGEKLAVKPYGIPYRCLVPKGWHNLLVACRGASFSRTAASSARLQRTILWIGRAAGIGAADAAKRNVDVGAVNTAAIVKKVGMDRDSVDAMLGKTTAPPAATGDNEGESARRI